MMDIEAEVSKIDKHLKQRIGGLKDSLRKTVSFTGLQ